MPQAIAIVVDDSTATPRTFDLQNPAAGLGSTADWAYKVGDSPVAFPRYSASARKTPNKARAVTTKFVMPHAVVQDSLTVMVAQAEANINVTVPDAFPESKRDDFVALATGLFADALTKAMIRDGLPAT
jgi:hypothetical protein